MAKSIPSSEGEQDAERDVVAAACDRQDWARRQLFDAHYPQMFRFLRSRVPTNEQAEDLASDVFLEAYRSIGNFEWRNRPFEAWLYGIARHGLASFYRADSEKPDSRDLVPANTVRDEFLGVEVRDLLGRLSPDHRLALELRFIIGLSGEEAAAVMGRSHGSLRTLLHRAVRAFREVSDEPSEVPGADAGVQLPVADILVPATAPRPARDGGRAGKAR